jgi:enediyne biosynthesis protein E4
MEKASIFFTKSFNLVLASVAVICLLAACKQKASQPVLFNTLLANKTGLHFNNKLTPTNSFNMFSYMYFYNGAGVATADFNNDGLTDVFFTGNQVANKLYLNKGNLQFTDVTDSALIINDGGWSTGASVVDINQDGLMDIYVCRVGKFQELNHYNQLWICQGIKNNVPYYTEQAKNYGLDFQGFGTQAAFFDYDLDGDLDMYLMNHSLRFNGTFNTRSAYQGSMDTASADYLLQNQNGKFVDVSKQAGILQSIIGYGLGIAVNDVNNDGYPDIYIGNDFHENDYLYINQRNGNFKEQLTEQVTSTSQFSMGVDVADITNDGYPEIVSMDMLPSEPYILKTSLGEDEYNIFNYKVRSGYEPQYARNTLQLNNRNNSFTEVGKYANMFATDWSWAALFTDFNNDGLKDLFISNGIPKRLNNMDYVAFLSNTEIQEKIRNNQVSSKELQLIEKYPQIKIPNKFFVNQGNAQFADAEQQIANNVNTYSNGTALADFDNDGDVDIVVNNIDDEAVIYQNNTNSPKAATAYATVQLKGDTNNLQAIGSRVLICSGKQLLTYDNFCTKGFQGTMYNNILIGLKDVNIDSCFLIWPNNRFQKIELKLNQVNNFTYSKNLPLFNFSFFKSFSPSAEFALLDVTSQANFNFTHKENLFNEFDREPLTPFMVSREGGALAVADVNNDGLQDVFMGNGRGAAPALLAQLPNGNFINKTPAALLADTNYEIVHAQWADINNDKLPDLITATGGNEYYGITPYLQSRIFINKGNYEFEFFANALPSVYFNASCLIPIDVNGDGFLDLFAGARSTPMLYGELPQSYIFINNKQGQFTVDETWSKNKNSYGLVTSAQAADIDKDNKTDLLVTYEWGNVVWHKNLGNSWQSQNVSNTKGWWNHATIVDVDNDGDQDVIAVNEGLNSRIAPSAREPLRLYVNDFDNNQRKEQVLTYYLQGKEIVFPNKDELYKQLPALKKKYLYADGFAKASLSQIFGKEKLEKSTVLTANSFEHCLFINNGKQEFTAQALPWQAQLTSYNHITVTDFNKDGFMDVILAGNYFHNNIQMGVNQANGLLFLQNNAGTSFTVYPSPLPANPFTEIRQTALIQRQNRTHLIALRNNGKAGLFVW